MTIKIAEINAHLAVSPPLTPLNKALIVTQGGTGKDAGSVTKVIDPDTMPLAGQAIATSEHILKKLTSITVIDVNATMASKTKAISAFAVSDGVASLTVAEHGLGATSVLWVQVTDCEPAQYNGLRLVTASSIDALSFITPDYGTITTMGNVRYAEGTTSAGAIDLTTGAGLTTLLNYHVALSSVAVSFNSLGLSIFVFDANTFFVPVAYGTNGAKVRILAAKMTTGSAHGLSFTAPSAYRLTAFGSSKNTFNGDKLVTALDATTLVYSGGIFLKKNGTIDKPATLGWISLFKITTSGAHSQPVGVVAKATITGTIGKGSHNKTDDFIATSTTVLTSGSSNTTNQGINTGGQLIDTDAAQLRYHVTAFYAQGSAIPVWVLDIGTDTQPNGVAYLSEWLDLHSKEWAAILLPNYWGTTATATMCNKFDPLQGDAQFESINYFTDYTKFEDINSVHFYSQAPDIGMYSDESIAAKGLYEVCSNFPTPAAPLRQFNLRYIKGGNTTPYQYNDIIDRDLLGKNITFADTNHAGAAFYLKFVGGKTMDSLHGSTRLNYSNHDVMQYWAVKKVKYDLERALEQRIIDGANNSAIRLNLDDSGGYHCINELVSLAQNYIDNTAIPAGLLQSGTVTATPYADFKDAHPMAYAARTYAGLSITIVTFNGFNHVIGDMSVSIN
ncbi:MAG: hypothetical protein RIR39_1977 [Pseudomonadota bacterium]